MASDKPPEDERNSDVDPWADLVADSGTGDREAAAFDFASLDAAVTDAAPEKALGTGDDDAFAAVSEEGSADPFAAIADLVQGSDAGGIPDAVESFDEVAAVVGEVKADADEHEPEATAAFEDVAHDTVAAAEDDESLDGDLFAELVGGGSHDDGLEGRDRAEREPEARGPFDVFEERDETEADHAEAGDAEGMAEATGEAPTLSVFAPPAGVDDETAAADGGDVFGFGDDRDSPFDEGEEAASAAVTAEGDTTSADAWGQFTDAAAAGGEPSPWDQLGDDSAGDGFGEETAEREAAAGFAAVNPVDPAAAVIPVAVAASTASPPRGAPKAAPAKKKGGMGQLVGIVLGGAASIPIVIALLIGLMWMGRPDPIGLRRWLPGASFLLPPVRQVARQGAGQSRGPKAGGLDSLPGLAGLEPQEPAGRREDRQDGSSAFGSASADGDADAPADAVKPADGDRLADADKPADADALADAGKPEMRNEPSAPAPDDLAAVPVPVSPPADLLAAIPAITPPGIAPPAPMPPTFGDPLAVPPPAVPPPPEPEPLDLTMLDGAIDEAVAAGTTLVETAADDPQRRRHMVSWYRTLTRVAVEMASLEAVAVETGRPFEEATVRLDPLLPTLDPEGPLAADLMRLARNWLSYSKRDSDGVVLPVTFDSTRAVGPYWCSKVLVEEAEGQPTELAVVSRQAPVAELGERCLVTGVIFDGGTVWAADLRSVDRPGTAVPVPDAPEPPASPLDDAPLTPLPEGARPAAAETVPPPTASTGEAAADGQAPAPAAAPVKPAPALEVPEIDPVDGPAPPLEAPKPEPVTDSEAPAPGPAPPADTPADEPSPAAPADEPSAGF